MKRLYRKCYICGRQRCCTISTTPKEIFPFERPKKCPAWISLFKDGCKEAE